MEINDCVLLTADVPEESLYKGMQGVIVAIFENPELAYEVEFCNENGETLVEVALKPELLKCITPKLK